MRSSVVLVLCHLYVLVGCLVEQQTTGKLQPDSTIVTTDFSSNVDITSSYAKFDETAESSSTVDSVSSSAVDTTSSYSIFDKTADSSSTVDTTFYSTFDKTADSSSTVDSISSSAVDTTSSYSTFDKTADSIEKASTKIQSTEDEQFGLKSPDSTPRHQTPASFLWTEDETVTRERSTTVQHIATNTQQSPTKTNKQQPNVRQNFNVALESCQEMGNSMKITGENGTVGVTKGITEGDVTCDLTVNAGTDSWLKLLFTHFKLTRVVPSIDQSWPSIVVRDCGFATYFTNEEIPDLKPPNMLIPDGCAKISVSAGMLLEMVFEFSTTNSTPTLSVHFDSASSGHVTTPLFDGVSRCCPRLTLETRLTLPAEYSSLVISFDRFFPEDCVGISYRKPSGYWNTTYFCKDIDVGILTYNTSVVISYRLRTNPVAIGFKMLFSFHTQLDAPERLSSGKFNCSGPNYELFKQHVACNLRQECEDKEDELGCEFSSEDCIGAIAYGDKCFQLVIYPTPLSWADARHFCYLNNSDLASFHTVDEMEAIMRLVTKKQLIDVYIGLKTNGPRLPRIYRKVLQWNDDTPALDIVLDKPIPSSDWCARFDGKSTNMIVFSTPQINAYLCDFSAMSRRLKSTRTDLDETREKIQFDDLRDTLTTSVKRQSLPAIFQCPTGHVTFDFLSCDPSLACLAESYVYACGTQNAELVPVPMFVCDNGAVTVSLTVTCDHYDDCGDGSDEDWCVYEQCTGFVCDNMQCITAEQLCDGLEDCVSGKDEENCPETKSREVTLPQFDRVGNTSVITLDWYGNYRIDPVNATANGQVACPPTHFRCPSWHCLPVALRCNGVKDCPRGEDEADCRPPPPCPGYYRCRDSAMCLHLDQLCDEVYHCPLQDDERYCRLRCPVQCRCQGLAFVCPTPFSAHLYPDLRYLDASRSGMGVANFASNFYLVSLVLRHCGIDHLNVTEMTLPNLRSLDVSHNQLTSIDISQFSQLVNLVNLTLAWNPVVHVISGGAVVGANAGLRYLDISRLQLTEFPIDILTSAFPNVGIVNVSGGQFHAVGTFKTLPKLQVLDFTASPILHFPSDIFQDLNELKEVHADDYKLCCRQILPKSVNPARCFAPVDEVSSCDDLLQSPAYRVCLWLFALVALVGNVFTFLVRCFVQKNASSTGFGVFVTHLSLSDFLMGVYLVMIGVADEVFHGSYLWKEVQWKQSVACQLAGFLSLLSNEVSALLVCLITLDRFLVIRFPFSQRRFGSRSASISCAVAWLIGLVIAAVPLFPPLSYWDFYGQTGICIPLPITRKTFAGQGYSFAVMIVANFFLFVLIAVGQVSIFISVRSSTMPRSGNSNDTVTTSSSNRSRDMAIAQRLAVIVMTDFLCWFPIGLLGLLVTLGDLPVPGEVGVALAIFVLPLNSALNPFLYTVNAVLAKRAQKREKNLLNFLETKIRSEMSARGGRRQQAGVVEQNSATTATTRTSTKSTTESSHISQDGERAGPSDTSTLDTGTQWTLTITGLDVPKGKITPKEMRDFFQTLGLPQDALDGLQIQIHD